MIDRVAQFFGKYANKIRTPFLLISRIASCGAILVRVKYLIPLAATYFLALPSGAICMEELAVYKAESIQESPTGMMWNDTNSDAPLETKSTTGITIGDKPDAGSDAKSVVFSGEQTAPFRSVNPFSAPSGALKISLAFKADPNAATAEQTLMRHPAWEFRYYAQKGEVSFVIWHDLKAYTAVAAKIDAGVWQQVTGTYEQGMVTIEVNGQPPVTREAKGTAVFADPSARLLIGASSGARQGGMPDRLLCGALADIHISAE